MARPAGEATGYVVRPAADDVEAAVRLADAAVRAHPWAQQHADEISGRLAARLRSGEQSGAVLYVQGSPKGFATWTVRGPLGLSVELLYIEPQVATVAGYDAFLTAVTRSFQPIVFLQGAIAGLGVPEEDRLMSDRGLRPYGRSEMTRRTSGPLAIPPLPSGARLRPVGPADERALVRLHGAAYRGRFDRYLFLESAEEAEDAAALVRDLFGGRWGTFSEAGSRGLDLDGYLVGAVLSVRRGEGTLIADVAVDPAAQGHGIGRIILTASLQGLEAAGESPVFLNVTEGNARAQRLYEHLGFERSLGPSREWYDPRLVPFPPDAG